MSSKGKKGGRSKGQVLSLGEFHKDSEGVQNNDWAEDTFIPEEDAPLQEGEDGASRRKSYSRTANNKLTDAQNFRDAPVQRTDKMVDLDMKGPFVGHFGNLTNGITEDELREEFNDDVIKQIKLVSNNGRTFANIEFSSVTALQISMLLDGKIIKGRKIHASVATEPQIERMFQMRGGNLNRDAMGSLANANNAPSLLSRDEFGSTQPDARVGQPGGMRPSASQTFDLSREGMGSEAQRVTQQPQPDVDFTSWREAPQEKQPVTNPTRAAFGGGFRDSRRSMDDLDQQEGARPPPRRESPKPDGSAIANWRDQPRKEQPVITAAAEEVKPDRAATSATQKKESPGAEATTKGAVPKDAAQVPSKKNGSSTAPKASSSNSVASSSRFAPPGNQSPPPGNGRFEILRK